MAVISLEMEAIGTTRSACFSMMVWPEFWSMTSAEAD
jgi:hypothetical protein